MKILTKYFSKELGFIFFNISLSGILIYILFDLLDRVDEFISSNLSFNIIITYFLYKVPMILSQIIPGVFFISIIIMLCLLYKRNEMIAILSGGINYKKIMKIFFIFSIGITIFHFLIIQEIGSYGMFKSSEIWKKYVRNKELVKSKIYKKWIVDKNKLIYFEYFNLKKNIGSDIFIYFLDFDKSEIVRYIQAKKFKYDKEKIILDKALEIIPQKFSREEKQKLSLLVHIDFKSLATLSSDLSQDALSFFQLSKIIEVFRKNGISIDELLTTWHAKIAYSFSLVLLTFLGIIIVFYFKNIYKSLFIGLGVIFIYYTLFIIGTTLAKKGVFMPFWGGWFANTLFILLILPASLKLLKN